MNSQLSANRGQANLKQNMRLTSFPQPKLYVLILILCSFLSHSQEPNNFSFVKMSGNVPYIVLDAVEARPVLRLLNSAKRLPEGQIYIDSSKVHPLENIYLYPEAHKNPALEAYELKGKASVLDWLQRRRFVIQEISQLGNGRQHEVQVDRILIHQHQGDVYIVLKGQPLSGVVIAPPTFGSNNYLPAYGYRPLSRHSSPNNAEIPEAVLKKTERLSQIFFKSLGAVGNSRQNRRVSLAPVRIGNGHLESHYCALFSYGERGYYSTFYVLDKNGEVEHRHENTELIEILGTTDVNRDGANELIMHFTEGEKKDGIGVMQLQKDHNTGKFNLRFKSRRSAFDGR